MNLTERQKEWAKVRDPRVEGSELYCQYGSGFCRERRCVSYDWERDECIHVLAAQAQVRAAQALERLAAVRSETDDLRIELEVAKQTIRDLSYDNDQIRQIR